MSSAASCRRALTAAVVVEALLRRARVHRARLRARRRRRAHADERERGDENAAPHMQVDRRASEGSSKLFPCECRERAVSYRSQMRAYLMKQVGEEPPERLERRLGLMPVMVKSKLCHLRGMGPAALTAAHEESSEMGGYFVINGNERAIRLLIAPRRDHLMGIIRPSFKNRGPDFGPHAVLIRCVRPDGTSQTVALHLLPTPRSSDAVLPAQVPTALSDSFATRRQTLVHLWEDQWDEHPRIVRSRLLALPPSTSREGMRWRRWQRRRRDASCRPRRRRQRAHRRRPWWPIVGRGLRVGRRV